MSYWSDMLEAYMKEKGLSKRQLSSILEIKYNTVTKWWHRDPSSEHIERIRKVLHGTMFEAGIGADEVRETAPREAVENHHSQGQGSSESETAENTDRQSATGSGTSRGTDISMPLTADEIKDLLLQHEVIRDPLHNDIWITALERAVIDSPSFQRLRNLSQLGPTQIVYPGAVHNRFMHSIGTLHWAEQLIQIVNRNHDVYEQPSLVFVNPYEHLLVRMCALLHDLAHMPFGHTLEDEGSLAKGQWRDTPRARLWLGSDPDWSVAHVIRRFLQERGISASRANLFIRDIRKYTLPFDKRKYPDYPMNLDYPFIVDIVSNTLCADLLDYLDRDMYFCGLRERSGDRVVRYLAVVGLVKKPDGKSDSEQFHVSNDASIGKGRVVLLTYRFEKHHVIGGPPKPVDKFEILSEAIDLLRRRLALAEKVYFHRTKIAASAMLISAMASSSIALNDIYTISDEELLRRLRVDSSERTRNLVVAYEARRLYKQVYQFKYRRYQEGNPQSRKLWDIMYPQYREPEWRSLREEEMESILGLNPGSIVIYCPDSGMNVKQFDMLVQSSPDSDVKHLKDIVESNRRDEMNTINARFEELWKLQVFVDPHVTDPSAISSELTCNLNALCENALEFPNDNLNLQGEGDKLEKQIADRVVGIYEQENDMEVPHRVHTQLVRASSRDWRKDGLSVHNLIDAVYKQLEGLMQSE